MKIIKILSIVLFLSLVLRMQVWAQADQSNTKRINNVFSISPVIIDTTLQKGQKKQIEMNIENKLSQPLGIKVTVENFYPSDGQTEISNQFKNSPLIDWMSISKDNFILDAKKGQDITLSINTPKDLKDGGYYAVVFFTPIYSKPIDNSSPTVLTKVGTLVLASAGKINYQNLKNKVSISNLNFNLFNESNPIKYSFEVQNSYFTHFSAKPFLALSPLLGKTQRIELEDKRVLPQTSRFWNETLPTKGLGVFNTASLAVSVGQGNYVYRNFFFFILPIREILVLILLILTILIIKFRKKQLERAVKIVFRDK